MSKNEQITVNIVRKKLEVIGITTDNDFLVDEQVIQNALIKKLLPSKTEIGSGKGRPEFLISKIGDKDFLIVIECKADIKYHKSPNKDQPAIFAVDGVLLYASKLSREFNVIAVAVSGQTKEELKITTFLFPKGSGTHSILTDTKKIPVSDIISWQDYIRYATYDENLVNTRKKDLNRFSRDLHNYLRDYAKITVAQMPLLVSGILIALMEKGFKVAYSKYIGPELAQKTFQAIKDQINKTTLGINQNEKKRAIINAFSFIEYHPELQKIDKKKNESPLEHIVREIDSEMKPFTHDRFDFDVIGNFYGEFIRYTGGDAQGLGIVLTPKHITELFVDLAKLDKNDKVLDTCCGTGGFLISAMKKMTEGLSEGERKKILEKSLIGIEQEPSMFALAVSNMILWGDGKTNLYQGSCFDEDIFKQVKNQASVGFINPPFSQKGENLHEWNFVITMLDALQKNATGIVIVPMSLAIAKHPFRERLLKEHRLEAVMSMPNDLFYPVGVVTCTMVFTAHVPHDSDPHHESWFGYWKDDGFRKDKREGRIPTERWSGIRKEWLDMFRRKEIAEKSVWKKVEVNDEWCAEAYLETDYSDISEKNFENELKRYAYFKLFKDL
jgi:SAM-dependent methyltransferase